MAKKPRTYNLTPEQMARSNARREAKGLAQRVDARMMGDTPYSEAYRVAMSRYSSKEPTASEMKKQKEDMAFSEMAAGMRLGAQQREQKRQGMMGAQAEYRRRKAAGEDVDWEEIKQLRMGPRVLNSPIATGAMNRFLA
jgi:hypothetical protein